MSPFKSCSTVTTTLLLLFVSHFQLHAQNTNCPFSGRLSKDDAAYADAMELVQRLQSHGFVVYCVFPTNFGGVFRVIDNGVEHSAVEGEANFRTNQGDIEVIFASHAQTFDEFKITETRVRGGYFYSFAGRPRVWVTNKVESPYRNYFLKNNNFLLIVDDDRLRDLLKRSLHLQGK